MVKKDAYWLVVLRCVHVAESTIMVKIMRVQIRCPIEFIAEGVDIAATEKNIYRHMAAE